MGQVSFAHTLLDIEMSGRGPSFIGLQSDLVVSTKQLWEFRIPYMLGWNDPPDRHAIVAVKPKLKGVFELAPRMNVKYSQFVKAVLEHIQSGTLVLPNKCNMKIKKLIAEEEACKARIICFHIRREWYRNKYRSCTLDWMQPFPRPSDDHLAPLENGEVGAPAPPIAAEPQAGGGAATEAAAAAAPAAAAEAAAAALAGAPPAAPAPAVQIADIVHAAAATNAAIATSELANDRPKLRRMVEPSTWSDDDLSLKNEDECQIVAIMKPDKEHRLIDDDDLELLGDEDIQDDADVDASYTHGYCHDQANAFRQLVFCDGTLCGGREWAVAVKRPRRAIEVGTAVFVDGAEAEVAGIPQISKKPVAEQGPLRRLRQKNAASSKEDTAPSEQGHEEAHEEEVEEGEAEGEEEEGEEEEGSEDEEEELGEDDEEEDAEEDDKEMEPKEGSIVHVDGLVRAVELNGKFGTVFNDLGMDGVRIAVCFAEDGVKRNVPRTCLTVVALSDVINKLRKDFIAPDGESARIAGEPQAHRQPLIRLKKGGKHVGHLTTFLRPIHMVWAEAQLLVEWLESGKVAWEKAAITAAKAQAMELVRKRSSLLENS